MLARAQEWPCTLTLKERCICTHTLHARALMYRNSNYCSRVMWGFPPTYFNWMHAPTFTCFFGYNTDTWAQKNTIPTVSTDILKNERKKKKMHTPVAKFWRTLREQDGLRRPHVHPWSVSVETTHIYSTICFVFSWSRARIWADRKSLIHYCMRHVHYRIHACSHTMNLRWDT